MANLNNSYGIVAQANPPLNVYTQLVSFTPAISGSTTAGIVYTTQAGTYYVVGKIVFVNVNLTWTRIQERETCC